MDFILDRCTSLQKLELSDLNRLSFISENKTVKKSNSLNKENYGKNKMTKIDIFLFIIVLLIVIYKTL